MGLPRVADVSPRRKGQQVTQAKQTFELFPDVCHFFVDSLLFELLDATRANIRNKLVVAQGQRPPSGSSFIAVF